MKSIRQILLAKLLVLFSLTLAAQKPSKEQNATKYDAVEQVKFLDKFYESEYPVALYVLNPEYTKPANDPGIKSNIIKIEFRYDNKKNNMYSERIFKNFEKKFDFDALRKMIQ